MRMSLQPGKSVFKFESTLRTCVIISVKWLPTSPPDDAAENQQPRQRRAALALITHPHVVSYGPLTLGVLSCLNISAVADSRIHWIRAENRQFAKRRCDRSSFAHGRDYLSES